MSNYTDLEIQSLRTDVPNQAILDAVRNYASPDYQLRIPAADQAGVSKTVQTLMSPYNRQWQNEFITTLVNRIGSVIARSNSWQNPFRPFKRGLLEYGNTIEEIQVGLIEARSYNPDADYMEKALFARTTPEVQTNFHTVNRQDFYPITVNDALLARAFTAKNGLSVFINQLMEAPSNSDNWDEFLLTSQLFSLYEQNGGFYHVNIPDLTLKTTSPEDARYALKKMRAMASTLTFLSTKYNAARMPNFAKKEELYIFVDPNAEASMDVDALAAAFNIEKAEAYGRIKPLPAEYIGISGAQAVMTTEDFFVIADNRLESTSQWNPVSLQMNHFLHHWEVISCSRFVPAVMFWTGADDEVITVWTAPTEVTVTAVAEDGVTPTSIVHGGVTQFEAVVSPDTEPGAAAQGVVWSISGNESQGTFITQYGVLHVALDEAATSITVKAATTSVNPDLPFTAPVVGTLAWPISDEPVIVWPNGGTVEDIVINGVSVGYVSGTDTYTVHLPATDPYTGLPTVVTPSTVVVKSNGPVSSQVAVTGPTSGAYDVTVEFIQEPDTAVTTVTITVDVP